MRDSPGEAGGFGSTLWSRQEVAPATGLGDNWTPRRSSPVREPHLTGAGHGAGGDEIGDPAPPAIGEGTPGSETHGAEERRPRSPKLGMRVSACPPRRFGLKAPVFPGCPRRRPRPSVTSGGTEGPPAPAPRGRARHLLRSDLATRGLRKETQERDAEHLPTPERSVKDHRRFVLRG